MGFRFWRRIGLAPGISLNLSKSGASLSFGPPGARYTIGTHGVRATAGIPGTGMFYTVQGLGGRSLENVGQSLGLTENQQAKPAPSSRNRLSLGFSSGWRCPRMSALLSTG
jgi:Protein of unknown function (DUF4236)